MTRDTLGPIKTDWAIASCIYWAIVFICSSLIIHKTYSTIFSRLWQISLLYTLVIGIITALMSLKYERKPYMNKGPGGLVNTEVGT